MKCPCNLVPPRGAHSEKCEFFQEKFNELHQEENDRQNIEKQKHDDLTQENNPSMEWEKEFDKEFEGEAFGYLDTDSRVKTFIRETLTAQREEYKKLIEGMRKEREWTETTTKNNAGYDCTSGRWKEWKEYNQALRDVLEAISK